MALECNAIDHCAALETTMTGAVEGFVLVTILLALFLYVANRYRPPMPA